MRGEFSEMSADVRHGGLDIVGLVDAEAGEDVQGLLPVLAGFVVPVQGVMGVGQAVVGTGLIGGLGQIGRVL